MFALENKNDDYRCSICLDMFSDPVSTPCGHNFCNKCITQAWDNSLRSTCPLCKQVFLIRPELKTNVLFSEMILLLKSYPKEPSKPVSKHDIKVFCTSCPEPKVEAVKSCLTCQSSFCETHLEPHLSMSILKTHPLTLPLQNMKPMMCPKHQCPQELFCRTEQCCVCPMCPLQEHKDHVVVPLKEAYEQRKASLQHDQALSEGMVKERRLKIQELEFSEELSQKEAQRETTKLVKVFTDILVSVQKCLDDNTKAIEEAQNKYKKQAQILISELKQEVFELEKSSTQAQQLSNVTDPLNFLQRSFALSPAGLKEWSNVSLQPQTYEGGVARALFELKHSLAQLDNTVFPKLDTVIQKMPTTSRSTELSKLKQFAVDITLDPVTAHPELILCKDLKKVYHNDVKKWLLPSALRFDLCPIVLGKQVIATGKVYFEVQVKGKRECDLGVVRESINRKGKITASPLHGQWSICLRNSTMYSACTHPWTPLSLQSVPQKIGVFVDYEAGLVSFYDAGSADLIFSYTNCCFNDKLLPLFSPCNNQRGTNSTPLIITAVKLDKP